MGPVDQLPEGAAADGESLVEAQRRFAAPVRAYLRTLPGRCYVCGHHPHFQPHDAGCRHAL